MGRERSMLVEMVRALRVGPCLGDRPAGNTAFVAQGQSFSPRHQLFPIEERSAAVAGRSSFTPPVFSTPQTQETKRGAACGFAPAPWLPGAKRPIRRRCESEDLNFPIQLVSRAGHGVFHGQFALLLQVQDNNALLFKTLCFQRISSSLRSKLALVNCVFVI